jgi:hypothetical protein
MKTLHEYGLPTRNSMAEFQYCKLRIKSIKKDEKVADVLILAIEPTIDDMISGINKKVNINELLADKLKLLSKEFDTLWMVPEEDLSTSIILDTEINTVPEKKTIQELDPSTINENSDPNLHISLTH